MLGLLARFAAQGCVTDFVSLPAESRPRGIAFPILFVYGFVYAQYWSAVETLYDVWDADRDKLVVSPIPYVRVPPDELRSILQCSDEDMLERTSTSPKEEPEYFLREMRASLQFLLDNPDWERSFPRSQSGSAAARKWAVEVDAEAEERGEWALRFREVGHDSE